MRVGRALGLAVVVLTVGASALWLTSRPVSESLGRPELLSSADQAAKGAGAFIGAGFGGISMDSLQTNAVPWRLVAAALVMEEAARYPSAGTDSRTLDRVLARFGFLPGAYVVNLPAGLKPPASELPVGMTYGDVAPVGGLKIRVANLGCAACHAGVTYAPDGSPRPDAAMLGMPNTSLDLEAYTLAVFAALRRFVDDPRLLQVAAELFPSMDWREGLSLRFLVLPLAKQRLETLEGTDRPLPFPNGWPGSTNGVAALKLALGTPLTGGGEADAGVVSIPDLSYRTWRTDLLADGIYAVPAAADGASSARPDAERLRRLAEITTFFTVPSMGVHPDKARDAIDDATAIMAFLRDYRPQPFPGTVSLERVVRGRVIFTESCESCHGKYTDDAAEPQLTSFPNWRGDVGTDRLRAEMFDAALVEAVGRSPYQNAIAVRPGSTYVAPPLGGIWASAPYLHNGSVPTLSSLLSPEERPQRFMVGGHALDFERVGIRLADDGMYPTRYAPFSTSVMIDTDAPGRGAQGHRYGEKLSPGEKRDLIEYLKLL